MDYRIVPGNKNACLNDISSLTERDYSPQASELLKGIYDYLKSNHLDFYISIEDRATNPKEFIEKANEYLQNIEVTNE